MEQKLVEVFSEKTHNNTKTAFAFVAQYSCYAYMKLVVVTYTMASQYP